MRSWPQESKPCALNAVPTVLCLHTATVGSKHTRSAGDGSQKQGETGTAQLPAVSRKTANMAFSARNLRPRVPSSYSQRWFPKAKRLRQFPAETMGKPSVVHELLLRLHAHDLQGSQDHRFTTATALIIGTLNFHGFPSVASARARRIRSSQAHLATSGIMMCLPGVIFWRVPIMVWRMRSGEECLVKLSLKLSSPFIFLTEIRPRDT